MVSSTWSATDWVTLTPSSRANRRAVVVTAAVSWRRCLVNSRSWVASRLSWASRSAAPTATTWSTCSGSRRTSRLTTHAATDALRSPLIAGGPGLVGLVLLDQRVARGREVGQREAVELVGDRQHRVGHGGTWVSILGSGVRELGRVGRPRTLLGLPVGAQPSESYSPRARWLSASTHSDVPPAATARANPSPAQTGHPSGRGARRGAAARRRRTR